MPINDGTGDAGVAYSVGVGLGSVTDARAHINGPEAGGPVGPHLPSPCARGVATAHLRCPAGSPGITVALAALSAPVGGIRMLIAEDHRIVVAKQPGEFLVRLPLVGSVDRKL
jgi:hypothetical protein